MSNQMTTDLSVTRPRRIVRYLFIGILALQILFQAGFTYQLFFTPEAFYDMSSIPFDNIRDYDIINHIMGVGQLFIIGAAMLGIYGAQIGNRIGIMLGMLFGLHFVAVGFAVLGLADFGLAMFDIIRGMLTVGLGFVLLQSLRA